MRFRGSQLPPDIDTHFYFVKEIKVPSLKIFLPEKSLFQSISDRIQINLFKIKGTLVRVVFNTAGELLFSFGRKPRIRVLQTSWQQAGRYWRKLKIKLT